MARTGAVLADRYYLRMLRTPKEVRSALRYVLLNARRHARRLAGRWSCDPASSGRWFSGWRRPPASSRLTSICGRRSPPVAAPYTWLLRSGWRPHGLLDPTETPGARATL